MKIYLRDRNPEMVKAWKLMWKRTDQDVEISEGEIFDGPLTDAIVSPANSFGYMDGGIDLAYSKRWPHLQGKLQDHLLQKYYGELPVGQAAIVPIHEPSPPDCFRYLICAPTMRVPSDVRGTVNAYLAFRAAIIAVLDLNNTDEHISSILCPGMGTAIGMMPHAIAAMQMYFAWKYLLVEPLKLGDDLGAAWNSHQFLKRGVF